MTEKQGYFDLEIGDFITFWAGSNHYQYPMTFTLEECVEEYCAMHSMKLMRILKSPPGERSRDSGTFWYKQEDIGWRTSEKRGLLAWWA